MNGPLDLHELTKCWVFLQVMVHIKFRFTIVRFVLKVSYVRRTLMRNTEKSDTSKNQ